MEPRSLFSTARRAAASSLEIAPDLTVTDFAGRPIHISPSKFPISKIRRVQWAAVGLDIDPPAGITPTGGMSRPNHEDNASEYLRPQPSDGGDCSRSRGSHRPAADRNVPPAAQCGAPVVPDQAQERQRPHNFLRYTPDRDRSPSGQYCFFSFARRRSFGTKLLYCSGTSPASVFGGSHTHLDVYARNIYRI